MTASLVSFQGFTYKMTRVTFPNCFTSGVHLNRSVTVLSNEGLTFVFNKWLIGGGGERKSLLKGKFCWMFNALAGLTPLLAEPMMEI